MRHRTFESQFHGQQHDYLRILEDKFGTPGPDRGRRYPRTDNASACNEGDGNYRKSLVNPDNESYSVRCSVKTASCNLLSMLAVINQTMISCQKDRFRPGAWSAQPVVR
jgi:hypothetical protein